MLRHDVIGPISNAGLALAMLHQPGEGEHGARRERLADEVQSLLDEGVTQLRGLDDWLIDRERCGDAGVLFEDCSRIVSARLLVTGKRVALPAFSVVPELSLFSSRYIVLAWLLCLLDTLPEGQTLDVQGPSAHVWTATPGTLSAPAPWPGQPEPITREDLEVLAAASGWQTNCSDHLWTLSCPALPRL
ncbi:hypothetical protein L500_0533 [Bordetella holmesii CDC-H643-BH]|uniref:hypothetical protein n=1 Tax=Bordetella holmesii TaxID=35814 RepID=UPI0002F0DB35|nr:hypothetical protein [Bordetella holmesii]KAK85413.1 hypothetical protein L496_0773 [Bordetella holmesii CDC-H572-BH]KCV01780.1 hypothetical protein L498_0496 [Bordetella holmesii CDC-H629-BH]KCV16457.1 hypothetical protein L500_0533 [Bordetella holmesii CDC-H643-BH]